MDMDNTDTVSAADPRIEKFVGAVTPEAPQAEYHELAKTRYRREGNVVSLFSRDDIMALNQTASVRGFGGGGAGRSGLFPNEKPRIPSELDGPEHRKWRQLLNPLFSPSRIRAWEAKMRENIGHLLDNIIENGEVEFYQEFAAEFSSSVFIEMYGAHHKDRAVYQEFSDGIIRAEGENYEEVIANAKPVSDRLRAYVYALMEEKRKEPGDDLVSELLSLEFEGAPISDLDLNLILVTLLLGGMDTVTATLSLMFAWLAENPEERRRLVDNPKLFASASEELLRFQTPLPVLQRFVTEDVDLGGGLILKPGDSIRTVFGSANVDPHAFVEPLKVDPERKDNAHLTFGLGAHRCLGIHLARLELRVALEEFHRRIPEYSIKEGETQRFDNRMIRRAYYLPLTVNPA
jgi:cytochrome P450